MEKIKPVAKAVVGGAVAFTGAVATGYADGVMDPGEWWFAASTGLAAVAVIFGVPNAQPSSGARKAA